MSKLDLNKACKTNLIEPFLVDPKTNSYIDIVGNAKDAILKIAQTKYYSINHQICGIVFMPKSCQNY